MLAAFIICFIVGIGCLILGFTATSGYSVFVQVIIIGTGIGFLIGAILSLKEYIEYKKREPDIQKREEKEEKNETEKLNELKEIGFTITKKVTDKFWVDNTHKLMYFTVYGLEFSKFSLYKYSDLADYELIENGENVKFTTVKHGTVGRAIVGGALFGVAGAVVGASTAPTTSTSTTTIDSMYIIIYFSNGRVEKINLLYGKTDKSNREYIEAKQKAQEILTFLHSIKVSN